MKQVYKDIALQVGGSHYPEVGGELLEKFGDMVVQKCIDAVKEADCKYITYTTFDKDRVGTIKDIAVNSINQRFEK